MRDVNVYLENILEQIIIIQKITSRVNYDEFINDDIYINAMSRSFEIIGEASKHIPDKFRQKYPEVEWRGMAGFRDKLIHSYFSIDTLYLWEVAVESVPILQVQIQKILSDEKL